MPSHDRTLIANFPGIAALEALHDWFHDPTDARRAALGETLDALARAAGASGAYLELTAPPLAPVAVGCGTLEDGPTDDDREGRGTLEQRRLTARDGHVELGTLWLAGRAGTLDAAALRVIEMAVDAAWARAQVELTAARLEALDEATRRISETLDLNRVLQLIVDRVRNLAAARYAALGIIDGDGRIERFITSGMTLAEREAIGPLPRGRGLLGLIIRHRRAYRIDDIAAHPDSSGFPPNHPPMTSFLGVPVSVKGRSVGNLYLTDKIGAIGFSEDDQRLVEMFAAHAAIAIENARLHEQVQRLVVIEERDRIGKDLHDGIIQGIYAVSLSLEDVPELMADDPDEAAGRVDRAIDQLHVSIRDIRNFILGLQSELLDGSHLEEALAVIADDIRLTSLIDVDVRIDVDARPSAVLDPETRGELLKIAREALSNVARHSGATRATVELRQAGEAVELIVGDNGRGFDPDAAIDGDGHFGLLNMRERAAALGARLSIDSELGAGTRIVAVVPIGGRTMGDVATGSAD